MDLDTGGKIKNYVLKEDAKNNILDLFIDWKKKAGLNIDKEAKDLILKLADDLLSSYSVSCQVNIKKFEVNDGHNSSVSNYVSLEEYENMFNTFMDITTKLIIEVIGIELEIHLNNKE